MEATRCGCVTNSVTSRRKAAFLRVDPIDERDDLDQRRRGDGWAGDVAPTLDPITPQRREGWDSWPVALRHPDKVASSLAVRRLGDAVGNAADTGDPQILTRHAPRRVWDVIA